MENKEVEKKEAGIESVIKYVFFGFGALIILCVVVFVIWLSVPEKVIKVGNEKITQDKFNYYYMQQVNLLLDYKNSIDSSIDDMTFLTSEYTNGMSYSQAAAQRAMKSIAESEMLLDLANGDDEDYIYDKEELKDAQDSFVTSMEEYVAENDTDKNDASVYLYGCTYKTLLECFEDSWITSNYREDAISEYEGLVEEESVREYYDTFKQDLDTVSMRHILIASFDVSTQEEYSEEDIVVAVAKAQEAYSKVLNGADFIETALEYSEDPGVVEDEGLYEFKYSGTSLEQLSEWAFAAEVGDIGFVETAVGYHILTLEGRTGFEESRETCEYNLALSMYEKKLEELSMLDDYQVAYYDSYYSY